MRTTHILVLLLLSTIQLTTVYSKVSQHTVVMEDGSEKTISLSTNLRGKRFPDKVLGAYLCGDKSIKSAQQIKDSGFNVIFASFFDISIQNGQMIIQPNKCCGIIKPYKLFQELSKLGVIILASSGGDGCQGAAPYGFEQLSSELIVRGFEDFREQTEVDWDGLDIDWESSNSNSLPQAINQLGRALRPKGYFVTAVPMSSQFVPAGTQGWTELDPSAIDVVSPQWYQGGCVGTQSCPCWGPHPIDDLPNCPGFKQTYMQQAKKCSIKQWVEGFKQVGAFSWGADQILIGAKSWCGGDVAAPCQASDTGIWGYQQMIDIIEKTGARGTYFWDLNDYYQDDYYLAGNPINDKCKWANKIAEYLKIPHSNQYAPSNDVNCANYAGPLAQNCLDNPWK